MQPTKLRFELQNVLKLMLQYLYVPSNAAWVYVGVKMRGVGKVEFYNDKIEEYSYK